MSSLAQALAAAALPEPVFVIGGAVVYRAALPLADALFLTEIDACAIAGDVHFPAFDRSAWQVNRRGRRTPADGRTRRRMRYVRYDRLPQATATPPGAAVR